MIVIVIIRGYRTQNEINKMLKDYGWEILSTSKKSILDITKEELRSKYDFNEEQVDFFLTERDDIYYNNKKFEIEIEPSDVIEELKYAISKKNGVPVQQMRLIYHGEHLDDDRHLYDYNIQRNSLIELSYRLRGD
jgi:ubiquitin-large subunit ribosomal protein L40e